MRVNTMLIVTTRQGDEDSVIFRHSLCFLEMR